VRRSDLRNDDFLLLLAIGLIGSAVLALLGGALGFVFGGLSLGVSQLKAKRRVEAVEKLKRSASPRLRRDQAEG